MVSEMSWVMGEKEMMEGSLRTFPLIVGYNLCEERILLSIESYYLDQDVSVTFEKTERETPTIINGLF
jgi:hypothetical protein